MKKEEKQAVVEYAREVEEKKEKTEKTANNLRFRQALWEFKSLLETTIITQEFTEFCEIKPALNSIYDVMQEAKDLRSKYGLQSELFAEDCLDFINITIRPFVTKWHFQVESGIDLDTLLFSEEFSVFQKKVKETFIIQLELYINAVHGQLTMCREDKFVKIN